VEEVMAKSKLPFVSVVVCCYNGADVLPDALQALRKQRYKGGFEIIVVDDGSKDNTFEVASSFKDVRVIRNDQNQGLAGSRNVGVEAAKGEIVAFTDDDCRPKAGWIRELAAGYSDDAVLGVGGSADSSEPDNLMLRYLEESKPLKPLENTLLTSKKLTYRFGLYLKGLAGKLPKPAKGQRSVYSLVGANMSFRKSALESVGGFDAHFRFGGEEEDLCKRLNEQQPGSLVFTPKAVILHQYERTLKDTLRRSQAYAKGNARMYHKHKDVNPIIFPFPILLAATLALGLISPWLLLTPVILIPLLYSRWTMLAIKGRRIEAFLYGYIQFLQECYGNVGFIKGWWQFRHLFKAQEETTMMHPYAAVLWPVTLLGLGMVSNHMWPSAQLGFLVACGMTMLPGYLIIRSLSVPIMRPMGFAILSTIGGAAWLMVWGFIATVILPHFGVQRPLDAAPFTWFYLAGIAPLVVTALRTRVERYKKKLPPLSLWTWLLYSLAVLMPIMAFLGASMLNQGRSNLLTIATFVVAGLAILIAIWRSERVSHSVLPALLFSISISAVWSYSLRSGYLFGWDIQQEFDVFRATQQSGVWAIGQHTPYDAMLSLTALPSVLANVAGIHSLIVFKVLFPVIFSLVPVVLYYAYRLLTREWIAFTAAALSIAQFYYMQQFSALIRQQLAFLFFATIVYLLVDRQWDMRLKRWFIGLLMFGLTVSHYSTTYMAIAVLLVVYVFSKIVMLIRRDSLNKVIKSQGYVTWWSIVGLIVLSAIWYGPMTHSSSAMAWIGGKHEYSTMLSRGKHAVEQKLQNHNNQPQDTRGYLDSIGAQYHEGRSYYNYYADADNGSIQAKKTAEITRPDYSRKAAYLIDTLLRYGWWLLGLVGASVFIYKAFERFEQQRLELGLFTAFAGVIFIIGHALPGIDEFYNITRINQQMLMFVALPAVLTGIYLLRHLSEIWQKTIIGSGLVLSLLLASGSISQVLGGVPTANLNNYGGDYQRFYVHRSDVAAATWLSSHATKDVPVFADRYAALRLVVSTDIKRGIMYDVTPETIAQGSYVYADHTNVIDGLTMTSQKGQSYSFEFPAAFLDGHKDLLYSNGNAEIYR
jgi:uncharacterized membrane protein/glycosyltransferase involved in cell wall biosynthesis